MIKRQEIITELEIFITQISLTPTKLKSLFKSKMKSFNYAKRRQLISPLLLLLFILTGCNTSHVKTIDCTYTKYVVYYYKDIIPWTVIRCLAISPSSFIEWSTDSLVETGIENVHSLYAYFDSLSSSNQSISIDEEFSFVRPELRYLDTDLAVVFISENDQDTLALSSQHYGGMTFHQRFFVDSVGHFRVFNIIKERDSTWARKFDELYVNGEYLL